MESIDIASHPLRLLLPHPRGLPSAAPARGAAAARRGDDGRLRPDARGRRAAHPGARRARRRCPRRRSGVAKLALHLHNAVELTAPGEKAVLTETVASGPYDLVVANDARALPLAFAAAGDAPVLADMHEWAPEERATVLVWRVLVGPYMEHLCAKYLPKRRRRHERQRGPGRALQRPLRGHHRDRPQRRRPAGPHADACRPGPHPPRAQRHRRRGAQHRRAHRGDGAARRPLHARPLPARGSRRPPRRRSARRPPRRRRGSPCTTRCRRTTLPTVLNQYDLGVFLYPLKTLSHLYHLPNKFFDFVQARLGLVFSPAPEIDAHIARVRTRASSPPTPPRMPWSTR